MTKSRWRVEAARVIRVVIDRVGTDDLDELEKEIRAAYPFGERRYWPYKVWLNEVRETMYFLRKYGTYHRTSTDGLPLFERGVE